MAWYRAGGGGGGVPASLKSDMNAVFNKKYGTSTDYPPTGWPDDVNLMGPLPKGKASGSIAHITDGANDVPTSSCEVTIAPTLTGVSSVSVTRTGRNLLNDSIRGHSGANIYFGHDTGLQNEFSVRLRAGTYTFSVVTADGTSTNLYVKNSDTDTNITGFPAYGALSKTFTLSEDTNCAVFVYKSGYTDVTDILTAQIEVGSTASAYEAYVTPTTYTASLGRTVHGGSVDIVNGTGTETHNKITLSSMLDGLTMAQIGTTGVYRVSFNLSDAKGAANTAIFNGLCDYYVPSTANQTYAQNEGIAINTSGQCFIYDSRFNTSTSLNDFKTWIDANPVNLCYELDTPTDFTFDGVEVPTLLAVNNFFSDVGDTSVEYRKDIGLAIGLNKYRYLRWKISATRSTSSYCQMSDIEFSDANGNTFTFPTGTTVTASTSATSGSSPAYIVDGNTATKFCGNWVTGGITLNIDLGMGNVIDVSVYKNFSWYTANDATDRDPKTWELYGIDNANNEILLCSRDYTPTTDRKALADTVTITPLE